mmetsp:Transcript_36494/g.57266  ORF Transcript_36494/g.57266 Transcript_36494/m.57266 type:complete len:265 (+) Transcript_36494:2468-3262(+)
MGNIQRVNHTRLALQPIGDWSDQPLCQTGVGNIEFFDGRALGKELTYGLGHSLVEGHMRTGKPGKVFVGGQRSHHARKLRGLQQINFFQLQLLLLVLVVNIFNIPDDVITRGNTLGITDGDVTIRKAPTRPLGRLVQLSHTALWVDLTGKHVQTREGVVIQLAQLVQEVVAIELQIDCSCGERKMNLVWARALHFGQMEHVGAEIDIGNARLGGDDVDPPALSQRNHLLLLRLIGANHRVFFALQDLISNFSMVHGGLGKSCCI